MCLVCCLPAFKQLSPLFHSHIMFLVFLYIFIYPIKQLTSYVSFCRRWIYCGAGNCAARQDGGSLASLINLTDVDRRDMDQKGLFLGKSSDDTFQAEYSRTSLIPIPLMPHPPQYPIGLFELPCWDAGSLIPQPILSNTS